MAERDLWDNTGRTKRYVIKMLRDCDIANIESNQLRTSDLIEHCKNRRGAGAKPATIYHDIAYLRSVMKKAKPVFNIAANFQIFDEAVPALIDMGLVGKSQKRTRRPTSKELKLSKFGLEQRESFRPNGKTRIPFTDILEFSILTCMLFPLNSRNISASFQRYSAIFLNSLRRVSHRPNTIGVLAPLTPPN